MRTRLLARRGWSLSKSELNSGDNPYFVSNILSRATAATRQQFTIDLLDISLPATAIGLWNLNEGTLGLLGYVSLRLETHSWSDLRCALPVSRRRSWELRTSGGQSTERSNSARRYTTPCCFAGVIICSFYITYICCFHELRAYASRAPERLSRVESPGRRESEHFGRKQSLVTECSVVSYLAPGASEGIPFEQPPWVPVRCYWVLDCVCFSEGHGTHYCIIQSCTTLRGSLQAQATDTVLPEAHFANAIAVPSIPFYTKRIQTHTFHHRVALP